MKESILRQYGKINVEIEGIPPYGLLMHNIENANLSKKIGPKQVSYLPEKETEKNAYWMNNGNKKRVLCVPERLITACILNGAKGLKSGKTALVTLMAGAIRVEPEQCSLGTDKYTIDTRAVVIKKARILRSRPHVKDWALKFQIIYNKNYLTPQSIEMALENSGIKAGLCDFAPHHKGHFGTFYVTKFEEVAE